MTEKQRKCIWVIERNTQYRFRKSDLCAYDFIGKYLPEAKAITTKRYSDMIEEATNYYESVNMDGFDIPNH